jgi:hypothetical protein
LFQAVFQRAPRWASILAGGLFLPLSIAIFGTMSMGRRSMLPRFRYENLAEIQDYLLAAALIGLGVGYIGGTLIAGIFLVSDYLVRMFHLMISPERNANPLDDELIPSGTLTHLAERAAAIRREMS